jgi:Tol biopolymer transport system component
MSRREGHEDIFVIRADGTGRRQLTNDLHKDRAPTWSPDGSRIAFYSDRSGSYRIWTIHPDGSGLQQMTEASGVDVTTPVWSPDGSRMAYHDSTNQTTYICQVGKPSKEPEALPSLDDSGKFFWVGLSWSPDGKWLAGVVVANTSTGASGGIAIYNLKSGQYRRLTTAGDYVTWLTDSRRLLFADSGTIFLLDIDSGRSHEVLSLFPDYLDTCTLSSDNRTMYLTRITSEADIWMLTLNEERE